MTTNMGNLSMDNNNTINWNNNYVNVYQLVMTVVLGEKRERGKEKETRRMLN